MGKSDKTNCKYVFVCGMPRSGTSILGRNIARLEGCTGLANTGELEDEGQFVQDVYARADQCGGDGRFGFNPRMHLTETSDLLTSQNIAKLHQSWHRYWDDTKTIFVEKSPSNLLKTRFLQAAFPNSYFVVIRRHPLPVSLAIQKWKVNVTSLYNLFEHWLRCHRLFDEDKRHLRRLYELSYENYVANPTKYHEEIAQFIGTRIPEAPKEDSFRYVIEWGSPEGGVRVPERAMEPTSTAYNQKYFDRWSNLLQNSSFKAYYRYIAREYEPRFAKYGYSLATGLGKSGEELWRRPVRLGAFYCLGADAVALMQRLWHRTKGQLRERGKAVVPQFVVTRIRRSRQKAALNRTTRNIALSSITAFLVGLGGAIARVVETLRDSGLFFL